MKIALIIFGILLLVFVIVQIFTKRSRSRIENYPYAVVKTFEKFEIRNYEASLFTSVTLPTNEFKKASNKGFSILAGYIFGGNKTNEKISMTSPVTMSLEDSMTVMFMVPKDLKKKTSPNRTNLILNFAKNQLKLLQHYASGGGPVPAK